MNALELNGVVAKILGVDAEKFSTLVEGRGMRPVKAAIKLGADARLAQVWASLKLATTVDDINMVYANEKVRSCMTGVKVGKFYHANRIGVIYTPSYRILVNIDTNCLCVKGGNNGGYGFHRDIITPTLRSEVEPKGGMISRVTVEKSTTISDVVKRVKRSAIISHTSYGWGLEEIYMPIFGEEIRANTRGIYHGGDRIITEAMRGYVKNNLNPAPDGERDAKVPVHIPGLPMLLLRLKYVRVAVSSRAVVGAIDRDIGGKMVYRSHAKDMHDRGVPGGEVEHLVHDGLWYVGNRWWTRESVVTRHVVSVSNEYRKIYGSRTMYWETPHVVYPKGASAPYLDFQPDFGRDITDEVINPFAKLEVDHLEDHYLTTLGDSYKERMNHPRRNIHHGRKAA